MRPDAPLVGPGELMPVGAVTGALHIVLMITRRPANHHPAVITNR